MTEKIPDYWLCKICGVKLPDSVIPGTKEWNDAVKEASKGCGISNHKCIAIYNDDVKSNPSHNQVKIYSRVIFMVCSKAGMPHTCDSKCKEYNHQYKHKFDPKNSTCVYGLPDGTLKIG
jgi:hypothetical protein